MTVPRHEIFKPEEVGVYHCISRCVRRAYLCGEDQRTGQSYEHRKEWVSTRLTFLSKIFAIDVLAYAIMSNHIHDLLKNRPDIAANWTPEEVARRWRTLFPLKKGKIKREQPTQAEIEAITQSPELVEIYRKRLSSISWFNRCLCEYIARRANLEDKCKGRFWEGRFKSIRVYNVSGLITCSVYIDLNPIRASIATTPEDSNYTSIQQRIHELRGNNEMTRPLLSRIEDITNNQLSFEDYLMLVDTTGRIKLSEKGSIPKHIKPILERLNINQDSWIDASSNLMNKFKRVIGPDNCIKLLAQEIGKNWMHGIKSSQELFG